MNSFEHVSRWTRLGLVAALACAPAARARAQSEAIKNQSNEFVGEGYGTPSGGQAPVDATSIVAKAKAAALKAGKTSDAKPSETTIPAADSSKAESWMHKGSVAASACMDKNVNKATSAGLLWGTVGGAVAGGIVGGLSGGPVGAVGGVFGASAPGALVGGVIGGCGAIAVCAAYHYGHAAETHYFGGN